jgi:hypothetical protein
MPALRKVVVSMAEFAVRRRLASLSYISRSLPLAQHCGREKQHEAYASSGGHDRFSFSLGTRELGAP